MKNRAFTLIELLVVVLIIGILAAIAVPQYQKAVLRSRLSEWALFVDSAYKAMEVWLLSNPTPEKTVRFVGNAQSNEVQGSLDIAMPCTRIEGHVCYVEYGRFNLACGANKHCWVDFTFPPYTGDVIWTSIYYDGSYNNRPSLERAPTDTTLRRIVCEKWIETFGKEQIYPEVQETCAQVGVE